MAGGFDDSTCGLRIGLLLAGCIGLLALGLLAACRDAGSGGRPPAAEPPLKGTYPAEWPRPDYPRVSCTIAGVDMTLEIAADPESRRYGMMFVEEMPDDWGMLFLYPSRRSVGFWMRNTRIPLDIAFLTELDGTVRVVNVHRRMEPGRESPNYPSLGACRMALELPAGWLDRHGLDAGDVVDLPDEVLEWPVEPDPLYMPNIPVIPRRGA